ncbi:hypothetical protein LCGC14_2002180, partial [marine sediment metagenome]
MGKYGETKILLWRTGLDRLTAARRWLLKLHAKRRLGAVDLEARKAVLGQVSIRFIDEIDNHSFRFPGVHRQISQPLDR